MASKIKEVHSISLQGVLDWDNKTIEVTDVGVRSLDEFFLKFNGEEIAIGIKKVEELD